ncbi:MAG TPA: DUF6599 family protein [Myxococcales bacterium]|jgi:hypothetical protein
MLAPLLLAATLAAAPAEPSSMASLFPKIDGYALTEAPTKYTPETLYEYIDGGADAFLMYDFEELAAGTYKSADGKQEIAVDLYRHKDAVRAFGMYLQERPNNSKALPIGVEGYQGEQHLEFVAGAIYAKLVGKTELLKPVAEKVAAGLPGTREPPAIFKAFPAEGRLPRAEKLSTKDFLGHAFLHDGFAVPYEVAGARFRLFAIQAKDPADAKAMLEKWFALSKAKDPKAKAEGTATIKDPLNGEVDLAWRGQWLWGAVDGSSPNRKTLVQELGKALK